MRRAKRADFYVFMYIIYIYIYISHFYFPASGQAVVTGVAPSSPRLLRSIFIAHRVQQSHHSSIFHRMLLTHALALSASQFVHKKKSPRIHTSMNSGGFELTKLTCTNTWYATGATGICTHMTRTREEHSANDQRLCGT